MKMKFAERLKELRKENGYTQVMLAEALGLSKGTVGKITICKMIATAK